MRPGLCLAALAAFAQPAGAQQRALDAELRALLAFCHAPPAAAEARRVSGAYGTIAIDTARRPCELSFELAGASMGDVLRIVQSWVRAHDPGATYRHPDASRGRRAIWALKRSTLRLDFSEDPTRGRLSVSRFTADR